MTVVLPGVAGVVFRVKVLEQVGLQPVGLKLAVTPVGRLEAEKVEAEEVPDKRETETLVVMELF